MLPDPFFVSLHASFSPERAAGLNERYAFRIDDRVFEVAIANGSIAVRDGAASDPVATFTTTAATLFALRRGMLRPRSAITSGAVKVAGDPQALERFVAATAWSKEMLARLDRGAA
jgi:putative sterol carrier protein